MGIICKVLRWVVLFACYGLLIQGAYRLSSRVVKTKYGAVRGFISTLSASLQPVEVFLGVPYASPPIGSLRFMPPVTPPHWRGIKMSDHYSAVCPQKLPATKNETSALKKMPQGRLHYLRRLVPYLMNQSEDCLYLNIYSPAVVGREQVRLPVIVFVHGESYEWNSGNPYDGSVLSSYGNIVVVTINYRLGVLGFLPSLDGSKGGNYGLLDQVAALHWIQENIGEFGGDPSNVTVLGQGHGAACVNLLMLSPMVRGLFQRVILQSGSALSPWAMSKDSKYHTRILAKQLGCLTDEISTTMDCLRQKPVTEIMRIQLLTPDHLSAFGPTIDGVVIQTDPAVSMAHKDGLFSQYHLLYGVTRIESYFHFSAKEERLGIEVDRRNRLLRTLVRNMFTYHLQETFLTIVNEYTDWTRPVEHPLNLLDAVADAIGDGVIVAPLIRVGNMHSLTAMRTYFYVFMYQTEDGDYPQRLGCIHGEELAYLFGAPLVGSLSHFQSNYSKSEVALSEMVMTFWTNFAKFGDPNVYPEGSEESKGKSDRITWPQYEMVHQNYLSIGSKTKIRDHYHAHRLSFWLHLIPSLNRSGSSNKDHHQLDDHDNPMTYDGEVRRNFQHDTDLSSMTERIVPASTTPPGTQPNSTEHHVTSILSGQVEATVVTVNNNTDSLAMMIPNAAYSTALGVTIAIGCSLLILNVLIFAGVYYQRDKNKTDAHMWKRNYEMERPTEADMNLDVLPMKQPPMVSHIPAQMGHYVAAQDYPSPPSSPSKMNSLPPRVPSKLSVMGTKELPLPESQPLLATPGVRPPNQQPLGGWTTTTGGAQEVRVSKTPDRRLQFSSGQMGMDLIADQYGPAQWT